MIEKYANNGIYFSVDNNSKLFNQMQDYANTTKVSPSTSVRYAVSMRSASAKKKVQDLSQVKVHIATNSPESLIDLVKVVRDYHRNANFMYSQLTRTFPNAKCPPLAVTSMSVDDYYISTNIVAKNYSSMIDIENQVLSNLTMLAEELNSEEKNIRG